MPKQYLRTTDIAKALGIHVNTVRLYEAKGYFPNIPRAPNGYRLFSPFHLEQARLAYLTLSWPYVGDKSLRLDLVQNAVQGDLGMAMELAYRYLALIRVERTFAESAIEFLERWAAGHLMDAPRQRVQISKAAAYLDVSVDMLRNWERNGLIEIPRDPTNKYRLYGTAEFGRLRVIRLLVRSGYSLLAILHMLQQFDAGEINQLRSALELPEDEEKLFVAADRWLSTLIDLEQRAQAIIRQISLLIEMSSSAQ